MAGAQQTAPLAFMAVWITGWSVGVAFIESMVIGGDWGPLIFLFTHGGAEVLVLWIVARQLYTQATTGSSLPRVELTHDGVTAEWTAGEASRLRGVLAAVIGVVAHLLLFGGILSGLGGQPGVIGYALAVIAGLTWCGTAAYWTRGVLANLRGGETVRLAAGFDGVEIVDRDGTHHLPLASLDARAMAGELHLRAGEVRRVISCVDSPAKQDLVEVLQLMAGRPDDTEVVAIPDALKALRGASTTA